MITLQPAGTRASVQGVSTTKNGIGICTQLLSGSLIIIFRSVTAHCILSGYFALCRVLGYSPLNLRSLVERDREGIS